ncbi:MAG: hypothetical protein Q9167_001738 [Letrouitia subvulpina]
MPCTSSTPRVITILGATGTGKSQLAVTLARRFNGEIINGDALQMYEGLLIATNKLPVAARHSIPHHLLGCIRLEEEPWTVRKYVHQAHSAIENITSRGKLPIIVGGTNYYVQSLLLGGVVSYEENTEHMRSEEQEKKWPLLGGSTKEMMEELERVDPRIARRWHPNDRRKIRHSLEVWYATGKPPSEIYDEQRKHLQGGLADARPYGQQEIVSSSNPWPSVDPLILWLHADLEPLSTRLEKRVEVMVENGLLAEVDTIHNFYRQRESAGHTLDPNHGIWIAIGYKELLPYVLAAREVGADPKVLEDLKKEGITRMQIVTRQYAKSQVRWIRLRLLRSLNDRGMSNRMFLLDGTDLSKWSQEVEAHAIHLISALLEQKPLPAATTLSEKAQNILRVSEAQELSAHYCEYCEKTLMNEDQWSSHVKSKRHKRATHPKPDWSLLHPNSRNKSLDAHLD